MLRRYTVRFLKKTLRITTFWMPDGKRQQYMVAVAEWKLARPQVAVSAGDRDRSSLPRHPSSRTRRAP